MRFLSFILFILMGTGCSSLPIKTTIQHKEKELNSQSESGDDHLKVLGHKNKQSLNLALLRLVNSHQAKKQVKKIAVHVDDMIIPEFPLQQEIQYENSRKYELSELEKFLTLAKRKGFSFLFYCKEQWKCSIMKKSLNKEILPKAKFKRVPDGHFEYMSKDHFLSIGGPHSLENVEFNVKHYPLSILVNKEASSNTL